MPVHPSAYLSPDTVDSLRSHAAEAERLGQLHPEQLEIIYRKNWFRLFVPKIYGGLDANLPEGLRLQEVLAWVDGSIGWTVTLCSGAGWFSGFLEDAVCRQWWADPRACIGGSGMPSGVATPVKNGWQLTGYWPYASGALQATVFTFNARVENNGIAVKNEKGEEQLLTAWVPRNQVNLLPTWNAIGMVATASHSFALENVFVPAEQCFTIDPAYAIEPAAVYRYPFLQLAETTIAVNLSGMCLRFLDLADPRKDGADRKMEALQQIQEWRTALYALVEKTWHILETGHEIPPDLLRATSYAARKLANGSRGLVNDLFPFCGMEAANRFSEINRVWRNVNTAALHSILH
ncbi:hypothetical protein [Flavihumibacter petaseus]|uniref:Putative oxidoreductase n=1 Tax=Flavihumibacter petaseus NBRC 106054 TaxID=1220578 RepID=A0A0E9MZE6_9BACT|nr:hypothetical protein [Flavihumibacter petaseus]GAO42475.1 putative oxidoreductase [Flavihumibacter petaseus NBRC 106054]